MEWKYQWKTCHTSIPQVSPDLSPTAIFLNLYDILVFVYFCGGFRELPLLCYILLAKIQISSKGKGISVFAPSLGLHEVYIDRNTWKA